MLNEICAEYGSFPFKKETASSFLFLFSVKIHKKRLCFPYCMHKRKIQTSYRSQRKRSPDHLFSKSDIMFPVYSEPHSGSD